jgi:hypothetical protein
MPASDDIGSTSLRGRLRRLRIPMLLAALAVVATTAILVGLLARRAPELGPAPQASRCSEPGRTVITTPRGSSSGRYSPLVEDDTTFDAAGSIWRPDLSTYPINIDTEAGRICWVGGQVEGSIPESMTWEEAHGLNQPCLRIVATEWMVVDGLRCDNTDDGIRPRETGTDAQNVTMTIHDTYLTRIHDDCLENDGVIGGLLQDNLWDGCNTGISERPSDDQGGFDQPRDERLVLDRMLIGLALTPHQDGPGENALFKWSDSANAVVIRCSVFKVDAVSLNGVEAMAIPGSVDDRACPASPTTLVWLGGGTYPGRLPVGIRVTADIGVWDAAVDEWTCRHDDVATTCGSATPS